MSLVGVPAAAARGVGIIAREPFAGGTLFEHPAIQRVCQDHPNMSPPQVALQYVLQLTQVDVVLAGVTARSHLKDNLKVFNAQPLSEREMAQLRPAAAQSRGLDPHD